MTASAYPLQWPEGWPRTPWDKRVSGNRFNTTFDRARAQLHEELRRLGATNVVVSSWLPLKKDGQPYADQARRKIEDPGCAVYFTLRGKQLVMARDAYWSVHENLRSIGLSIEGLRQMERHGGAHMMDRAFDGFAMLPDHTWRGVFGYRPGELPTEEQLMKQWKNLAMQRHPDRGGSDKAMSELNQAFANAKRELGY